MEYMWAAMGTTSDSMATDIVGGVNVGGHAKTFAGSNGSNGVGNYAWTSENTSTTQPVGSKSANELGLCDLTGYVEEWCWDWYAASYPIGALTNYKGPASGTIRIARCGDWVNQAQYATIALHDFGAQTPVLVSRQYGFRVVWP